MSLKPLNEVSICRHLQYEKLWVEFFVKKKQKTERMHLSSSFTPSPSTYTARSATWNRKWSETFRGISDWHLSGSTWTQHLSRLRSSARSGACAVGGCLGVSERLVGRESNPQSVNPGASAWTMNRRTWEGMVWDEDGADVWGVPGWWESTAAVICGISWGVNDL